MNKIHENDTLKRRILYILGALAAIALLIGVTVAWFVNQYRLSSIGKIHPLTYISILDPGDAVIQSIDLSYDKSEVHDGKVELKRPFVIRSESQYYDLCIAHTTNISGLEIKLYKADGNGSEGNAYLAGITEKGTPYYWNRADNTNLFTTDDYINKSSESDRVLADKGHVAHKETFRLTEDKAYDNVQKYAEPLYWVKTKIAGVIRTSDDSNYYTNYILEITWDETDKETDMLYVIAQTSSEGGSQ